VYVAQVAFGANMNQVVRALLEADSFPGPSLVIAYSHCIAHGYDLRYGADQQKLAVQSGLWPLYRFDPRRVVEDKPPLELDSGAPRVPLRRFMENETRFRMVEKMDAERFARLADLAQKEVMQRYAYYERLAGLKLPRGEDDSRGARAGAEEQA
ncbi:MAG: pyruvate:ferredoxin (flavodoxin) oxidoreductase, partial [bacterium]